MPHDALVHDHELPHTPAFDLIADLHHRHDRES
jgi:hypothetical protein